MRRYPLKARRFTQHRMARNSPLPRKQILQSGQIGAGPMLFVIELRIVLQ
ncbi:MAG: hypothetical protein ACK5M4_02035 [Pseudorhodobacter sp.]